MPVAGSCPRCAVALEPVGVPVGSARGCMRCAGLFLDDAAFGHVRESMYEELSRHAPGIRRTSLPAAAQARALSCPLCAAPMTRSHVGEVEIDLCAHHGIWFDRDELHTVAQIISASRSRSPPAGGRQLSPGEREALARSVQDAGVGTLATLVFEDFCEVMAAVPIGPVSDDD